MKQLIFNAWRKESGLGGFPLPPFVKKDLSWNVNVWIQEKDWKGSWARGERKEDLNKGVIEAPETH